MQLTAKHTKVSAICAATVAVLASVSIAFASTAAEDPQAPGASQQTQQQIINNYQCFGGGDNSVTLCIFNSVNVNLACNNTANAAKNLALLSYFFRVNPNAKLQNINQQQWQQIVNNYQCFGGGRDSVTICDFKSTNINFAANAASIGAPATNPVMSYFFRMHPDAKRLNAPIRTPDARLLKSNAPAHTSAALWSKTATAYRR